MGKPSFNFDPAMARYLKIAFLAGLMPVLYLLFDRFYNPPLPEVVQALNQPAFDFSLQDFHLSSLKGRPILLHFWATWCGPCVREMPEILALARSRRDIEIVAVSVDDSWSVVDNFFQRQQGLQSFRQEVKVLLDQGEVVASRYGSDQFPESILISRNFNIDNRLIGSQHWSRRQIQALLDRISR